MKFILITAALLGAGVAQAGEPSMRASHANWWNASANGKPMPIKPHCSTDPCGTVLLRDPIPPAQMEEKKLQVQQVIGGKKVSIIPQPDGSKKFVGSRQ